MVFHIAVCRIWEPQQKSKPTSVWCIRLVLVLTPGSCSCRGSRSRFGPQLQSYCDMNSGGWIGWTSADTEGQWKHLNFQPMLCACNFVCVHVGIVLFKIVCVGKTAQVPKYWDKGTKVQSVYMSKVCYSCLRVQGFCLIKRCAQSLLCTVSLLYIFSQISHFWCCKTVPGRPALSCWCKF